MDNINRKLIENARALVDKLAGECKGCSGMGFQTCEICSIPNPEPCECRACKSNRPCPTCADLRALRDELCWHEKVAGPYMCKHCGDASPNKRIKVTVESLNPTYTIQSLRKLLERMGEWNRFKCWHFNACSIRVSHWIDGIEGKPNNFIAHDAMFDILTSDELMAQAVLEYFKGRIG